MSRNYRSDKSIGVLTSGGDAQGMNSAIRAVVRMGLYCGCKVFFINEGFQGMVDGGSDIVEAIWSSVSNILHRGGTVIGSARCMDFKERWGRLKAAENLVKREITNLIVIGGDGSLTGANLFRSEWTSLLDELVDSCRITTEERRKNKSLHIVGVVASIDNDFWGTDMTIGADSALHRIIEQVDSIASTANSHQRTFILEVMGRHCGYLALAASLACEADFMFIPENPAPLDWRQRMCKKLQLEKAAGERIGIIILAEGAFDVELNQITAEMVRKAVVDELNHDTRITVLGHVQRGGNPSAFDQLLGCRMGAEAVLTLINAKDEDESCVIVLEGNRIKSISLMAAVEKTQSVTTALKEKRFEDALELRGRTFVRNLDIYRLLSDSRPALETWDGKALDENVYTLAVMHAGSPACGMNAAVHSFVRNAIYRGHIVYGVYDGFEGLSAGHFEKLEWINVTGWVGQGSANLRTSESLPQGKFAEIAAQLKKFKVQGLFVIGGFEAYHGVGQIADQRKNFPEFRIPFCVIPATIDNNIPGSEIALGVDTSLNEITTACKNLRLAGAGIKRVFVVETMGGFCGYLAVIAGLAAGADAAYIYEEKFTIKDLTRDLKTMVQKMNDGVQRGLLVRNEEANKNYSADFIHRLFAEEANGRFSARKNIFGHWQQGGTPSPFDRNQGTKMSAKAMNWILDQISKNSASDGSIGDESACILCFQQHAYKFIPIQTLVDETDFQHQIPKTQWWLHLKSLLKILAMHHSAYDVEEASRQPFESFMSHPH